MYYEADGAGSSLSYTFDGANNVKSLMTKTPDNVDRQLGYDYYADNRQQAVHAGGQALATYTWRADDQFAHVGYGNGMASITNTRSGGGVRSCS